MKKVEYDHGLTPASASNTNLRNNFDLDRDQIKILQEALQMYRNNYVKQSTAGNSWQDKINNANALQTLFSRGHVFGINHLGRVNSSAYEALPSPYRNDDCLEFFYEMVGESEILFCQAKDDQKDFLGDWKAYWSPKNGTNGVWKDAKHLLKR